MNAVSMYKFIEEYNALLTVFGINSSLWIYVLANRKDYLAARKDEHFNY
jgi:hypothetical protein